MLKLLEEPPRNTFIILCSQNPDLLLTTVVSRCQVIRLRDKPQRNIPKKILNSQFLILDSIVKSGVGERLKMADEIAKNREEAIRFCQAQLMIWREKIFKAQSAKTIHLILKTLNMLEANVNSKLALENLLLHYPFGRSGIVPGRTNR